MPIICKRDHINSEKYLEGSVELKFSGKKP
jgi:hypothetical protein